MPVMILTLPRAEVYEQDRLAQANDPAAIQYMENLWAGMDEDLSCLLCDAVVERPVHSLIIGSPGRSDEVTVVPVCQACMALPRLVKWNRASRLLRKMHQARTGKQRHYSFHVPHRR